MAICPYCKQERVNSELLFPFSDRQRKIFELISESGPLGTSKPFIMDTLMECRSRITLRTIVYKINKIIVPMKIRSKGNNYYLSHDNLLDS